MSLVDQSAARSAIRQRLFGDGDPFVEVNDRGQTIQVSGPWSLVCGAPDEVTGIEALAHLLEQNQSTSRVIGAINQALTTPEPVSIVIVAADGVQAALNVARIPDPVSGRPNIAIGVTDRPLHAVTSEPVSVTVSGTVPPGASASEPVSVTVSGTVSPGAATVQPSAVALAPDTGEVPVVVTKSDTARPAWTGPTEMTARREKLLLALVLLVAAALRLWDLGGLPVGLHGDEAIFGQESQRVGSEGWIGIYSGLALGQPTAPMYIGAIFTTLFGASVWAVRLCAAVAGVIAVLGVYAVARPRFGAHAALVAAGAMATMTWTVHFSRIGFPLAWWPVALLAAVFLLDRAAREHGEARDGLRAQRPQWVFAGGAAAFGIYVYTVHWLWFAAAVVFVGGWMLWRPDGISQSSRSVACWAGAGAGAVLIPMVLFMSNADNAYFNHSNHVGRRSTPEWIEAGIVEKLGLVARWYLRAWSELLFAPVIDGVDGSGIVRQVPLIFTGLALVGVVEMIRRHRHALTAIVLLSIAVLPLGPAMTVKGHTRRDFALSAMLAIAVGIGAMVLVRLVAERRKQAVPWVAAAGMSIVLLTSVVPYFTTFRSSTQTSWIFAAELTDAASIIEQAAEDGPIHVSWYSVRHYYDYSTLAFLLDGVPGTDRAPLDQGFDAEPSLDLVPGVADRQLFVLVGPYADQLASLQDRHPSGTVLADQPNPRLAVFAVNP